MTTNEIRASFLEFFRNKKHTIVPAASLVPANDPTLLFTNSGMVQFKDIFLGREKPRHLRVADVQPCLRAGGKHNDLENVGYTARHHTFFEMLGNWSFGDYFKRDAIAWAWELLTKVWKLPADRLWVTVYHTDDEAYDIWTKEVGVPKERIARIGDNKGAPYASDNFWQMADTGPCGPCTEIFWDHGAGVAGSPPGSAESEGDRYVEIWNLVFMQFDRDADGKLTALPKPCVDTGMGLERIAAVMQGVHSNYDIDLFKHLIKAAAEVTGAKDLSSPSLRVIADHIRACAFLITDGVLPSNEGRGYVLRRIIRRAVRHGYKLGQEKPFFHKLVRVLDQEMGAAYLELHKAADHVDKVLLKEEEKFSETLQHGLVLLERGLTPESFIISDFRKKMPVVETGINGATTKGTGSNAIGYSYDACFSLDNDQEIVIDFSHLNRDGLDKINDRIARKLDFFEKHGESFRIAEYIFAIIGEMAESDLERIRSQQNKYRFKHRVLRFGAKEIAPIKILDGHIAFTLYDTYGFPIDLTMDICRERGIKVDEATFQNDMERQRERGRAASQFGAEYAQDVEITGETQFTGYATLTDRGKVVALFRGKDAVKSLKAGEQGMVVLDRTPFYAESGGQVGDQGVLRTAKGEFKVEDTQRRGGGAHAHLGTVVKGEFKLGETVEAQVDEKLRAATVLNHSATHLLHAALRKVLGMHVTQKGSLVAPDRLRFDFSHNQPVTPEELQKIEDLVNTEIRNNAAADVRQMAYDDAIKFGAMALFGEKYGDTVRVMKFGDFSTELCGGTHVRRVGDIGFFKIVSESGVAAGIRRVEALTGEGAVQWVQQVERKLHALAELTKSSADRVSEKVEQLVDRNRKLEKELEQMKGRLASREGGDLASQAVEVNGLKVLASRLDGADAKTLRDTVDQLKNKLGSAAVVLAAVEDGKVRLVAGVTADRTAKIKAGELVNHVAEQVGGKGGGRADMAQAGGTEPANLDAALRSVPRWVRARLG
ncbi:MAG TPA: alanine--tRNA ligase [Gammaproteobacteria bacterium]|nr:alanine--tRNA ligase [Gammaproteobacteria bacterium]